MRTFLFLLSLIPLAFSLVVPPTPTPVALAAKAPMILPTNSPTFLPTPLSTRCSKCYLYVA